MRLKRVLDILSSIRFRLTLSYIAILGGVLVFFSIFIISAEVHNRASENDVILNRQAQLLINAYDPAIGKINQDASTSANEGTQFLLRHINFFVLFDLNSEPIQKTSALSSSDVAAISKLIANRSAVYENYQFQDNQKSEAVDYRIYATGILQKNQKVATLVVARLREEQSTLRRLVMEFVVLIPGVVLLTAIGAYWLASRTMAPVRAITHAAREIGETDLSHRLNLSGRDEIAELAATFDLMLGRLEAAFTRQQQFTRDASHELRTPLTIVNLELHHLLAHRRTPEEYEQVLSIIQLENQRMTHLVNDLLILARADAGQVTLRNEALDLSDLTLEVVERLAPLAHQQQIDLVVGQLPELKLSGDRLYLIQMLTNLVENAIKYTHGVGRQVNVETDYSCLEKKQYARVIIKDDGIGIAAEHVPYLFDRFYRVDDVRARGEEAAYSCEVQPGETQSGEMCAVETQTTGSGLGLSIVQWIIQKHGGLIKVHSTLGGGSTFEVYLPLCCVPQTPSPLTKKG